MLVCITTFVVLLLSSPAIAYPTPYQPVYTTQYTDNDAETPTPTYYQAINTVMSSSPPYYPPASTPAQSYMDLSPPSYTTAEAEPPISFTEPTTTTDCSSTAASPSPSPPPSPSSLILSSPLLILPASVSSSPTTSAPAHPHNSCKKCCPASSDNWIEGMGMKIAGELEESLQDLVRGWEQRCGIMGGGGVNGGGGGDGRNGTMITECVVYRGGVICAWVLGMGE